MYGPIDFKPVKLLVVEDNQDHWTFIEKAIQRCLTNVTAVHVASSKEALTLLKEWVLEEWEMPRLILLDLYLPTPEDGLALLTHIKAIPLCYGIPVVMLSYSDMRADVVEAYQGGISSYCVKPTSFEGWIALFEGLHTYWFETVNLPHQRYVLQ